MMPPSPSSNETCIHLIRHGEHAEFGQRLSGRSGTAALTESGRRQASRVGTWHGLAAPFSVHASPQSRTLETAHIIAALHEAEVVRADALDEIDFGEWSGLAFADLNADPRWAMWNHSRSTASAPGGETMAQSVGRAVSYVVAAARASRGTTILFVTHCDVIRGVLAHFLGLNLDNILRFDVGPGSISTIKIGEHGACIARINEVPA